jgi:Tol biopolymer transport system component
MPDSGVGGTHFDASAGQSSGVGGSRNPSGDGGSSGERSTELPGEGGAGGAGGDVSQPQPALGHRWLAYWQNTTGTNNYDTSVVDTANPATSMKKFANAEYPYWSPDGRYLTFYTTDTQQLDLVDFGSGAPGEPQPVDGSGNVEGYYWSPDMKSIAFNTAVPVPKDSPNHTNYVVDIVDGKPAGLTNLGPGEMMGWVTNELLTFNSDVDGPEQITRTGGVFGAPSKLPFTALGILASNEKPPRAAFEGDGNDCSMATSLYDFTNAKVLSGKGATFAPNLSFWANWVPATPKHPSNSYALMDAQGTPLGNVPSQACTSNVWSHDGSLFVSLNLPAIQVTGTQTPLVTKAVSGSYDTTLEFDQTTYPTWPVLSNDKAWLAFNGKQNLFLSPLNGAVPGKATQVNTALQGAGQIRLSLFSPDSKTLAYLAPQEYPGTFELYGIDLPPVADGKPKKLSDALPGSSASITYFGWSADSSSIAYEVYLQEPDKTGHEVLYLMSMQNPGHAVRISDVTCAGSQCPTAGPLQFQP